MGSTPNAAELKVLAKNGQAMPDGSYYIRDGPDAASDLHNAVLAVGRAQPTGDESEIARRNAVRRHIIERAQELKMTSQIPDTWNSDGSLKHSQDEEFLMHFGVRGMRWGVRKDRTTSASGHTSDDAARAADLKARAAKHGTSSLSNIELQHLVTRLGLEQQHGKLNPEQVSTGHAVLNNLLKIGGDVASQQARSYANKYAAQGLDALIKKTSA